MRLVHRPKAALPVSDFESCWKHRLLEFRHRPMTASGARCSFWQMSRTATSHPKRTLVPRRRKVIEDAIPELRLAASRLALPSRRIRR